jgi:1-deoxy-D-xylulose-5-phosphate synthase
LRGAAESPLPKQGAERRGNPLQPQFPDLTIKEGADIELRAIGTMLQNTMKAAEILSEQNIHARVISIRSVKPLDESSFESALESPVVTIEDNVIAGGYGERLASRLAKGGYKNKIQTIGWPDKFIPQGTISELQAEYGLDANAIAKVAIELLTRQGE